MISIFTSKSDAEDIYIMTESIIYAKEYKSKTTNTKWTTISLSNGHTLEIVEPAKTVYNHMKKIGK